MDTSLDRIREKIADLESKIANLKIAERELLDLEKASARQAAKPQRPAAKVPVAKAKTAESADRPPQQTIGAAITEVLQQHGALSASAIAEQVVAAGKDINNRAISFALQAMKKRGLVKTANGEWSLKGRSKR